MSSYREKNVQIKCMQILAFASLQNVLNVEVLIVQRAEQILRVKLARIAHRQVLQKLQTKVRVRHDGIVVVADRKSVV